MATWIFQCNPDKFDIDGYLEQCDSSVMWLVRQHVKEIAVGDTVFLWRSEGDGKIPGGIIAELQVVEPVRVQLDDPESLPFWKGEAGAAIGAEMTSRVRLRIVRLAAKREVLKREWLKEDPRLNNLAILRMAQQTNYRVTVEELPRLRALWDNTGRDWNRDESLAALFAYDRLFGHPISKGKDSIVSQLAQRIGRATTGVYNKLMNFRSLDPRAPQKGLDGSSAVDEAVWSEFFDAPTNTLNSSGLSNEYERLWGQADAPPLLESSNAAIETEAKRLERHGLQALREGFNAGRKGPERPARHVGTVASYNRDPRVVAITRLRAEFKCEVSGCQNHQFLCADGKPYVETHHLHRLSEGGADVPENTAAVCAIHHRELHHGKEQQALTNLLMEKRRRDSGTQTH
jgi:hypothetical protein